MRFPKVALIALVALAPALVTARPWKGVNPGQSTQADVLEKFGEPTTRTKRGTRTVLAYYGDQALDGTKQAQFHLDGSGTVTEVTVFLAAPLDAESIEGTYGKPPQKTFVEDTFQKVWLYPQHGVTVYFGKEGIVEALSFSPGTTRARTAAGDEPAAQRAGAAAR